MTDGTAELSAELVVDGATARQPAISPDGRWVVYAVQPVGQRTELRLAAIWLAAVDAGVPPRALTPGTAADSAPVWAADSASVFFLSGGAGPAQLHRVPLDGGTGAGPGAGAEVLTSWDGGISAALPLAGGTLVAVLAASEPTAEDKRRKAARDDAVAWGERVPPDRLWLLDLASGAMTVVGGLGNRHVTELVQRPGGGPLAVISWPSPEIDTGGHQNELHLVDPATGAVQDLGRAEIVAQSPAWWRAADGWHLCYLAEPGPPAGSAVFDVTVPAAGPAAPHRNLTEGMPACPAGLAQAGGGPPLALVEDRLDTGICRLDPGTRRFGRLALLTGGAGSLTASRSGEQVAVLLSTAHEPGNVHAGPPRGPLRRLSDLRPELRRVQLGAQERLHYTAADGLELDGVLILPAGRSRADGPFPLVTWVHGGPDERYADELVLHPHVPAQWLAAAGYAVFLPNPRGSKGRGHDFARAIAGDLGGGEFTDILTGIDQLVAEGVADPGRLGIGGGSHGGFMTAWAVGHTSRFRAALMAAAVTHWGMLVAAGENGTFEADLGGSCGWEGPGPHPHDQVSPVSFAAQVRTPVLIVHGEQDTNVPLGQAVYFHRALRHYGAEHELVIYPREGHLYVERAHQIDLLHRTRAWFDRWLRPDLCS